MVKVISSLKEQYPHPRIKQNFGTTTKNHQTEEGISDLKGAIRGEYAQTLLKDLRKRILGLLQGPWYKNSKYLPASLRKKLLANPNEELRISVKQFYG